MAVRTAGRRKVAKAVKGAAGRAKRAPRAERRIDPALLTYVAMVLDRSSSMHGIKSETISGFNAQLRAIQQNADAAGTTKVSLVTFADDVQEQQTLVPASSVLPLNDYTYRPGGNTAMNDAIGKTVGRLLEQPDADAVTTSFLVVVVTDGEENSSRLWHSGALGKLIEALQATGRWTFTVIGANIDLAKLTAKLRLHAGNVQTYQPDSLGTTVAWQNTAIGTGQYLSRRATFAVNAMGVPTAGAASINFYDGTDPALGAAGRVGSVNTSKPVANAQGGL